jgi:isocitrate dehydrogenase kinase/phosphatase
MDVWQQVKLLYIGMLVDAPAARAGRDLLQLGHHQDPAPQLLPERLHLRAPGHQHRVHGARGPGRRATYRAFYPGDARSTRCAHGARGPSAALPISRTSSATPCGRAMRRELGLAIKARRQLPDPGAVQPVLSATRAPTWSASSSTAFRKCRSHCPSCTAAGHAACRRALFGEDELLILFSFSRAYFMVDMEIPSAYVQFLRSLMPRKPRAEFYNALGLAKQGKNLFYRDFLWHLRHSTDKFRIAPGIKGMVMLVFDLPSFPYVFKVIKDFYPRPRTPRASRSAASTSSSSSTTAWGAWPTRWSSRRWLSAFERFSRRADRRASARAQPAGDLRPRRRRPDRGHPQAPLHRAAHDPAEHLPAGMLRLLTPAAAADAAAPAPRSSTPSSNTATPSRTWWRPTSSPATCSGRTSASRATARWCSTTTTRSSTSPTATSATSARRATKKTRCRGEIWYSVAKNDVFPETFGPFLLGNPRVREVFMQHHADLLDVAFWQSHQTRIREGHVHDVFPYEPSRRFRRPERAGIERRRA